MGIGAFWLALAVPVRCVALAGQGRAEAARGDA
jgi:hypothetical protein